MSFNLFGFWWLDWFGERFWQLMSISNFIVTVLLIGDKITRLLVKQWMGERTMGTNSMQLGGNFLAEKVLIKKRPRTTTRRESATTALCKVNSTHQTEFYWKLTTTYASLHWLLMLEHCDVCWKVEFWLLSQKLNCSRGNLLMKSILKVHRLPQKLN